MRDLPMPARPRSARRVRHLSSPAPSGASAVRSPRRGRPAASSLYAVPQSGSRPSSSPTPATPEHSPRSLSGPWSRGRDTRTTLWSNRVCSTRSPRVRLGQRLEASSKVRRLADNRLLLSSTRSNQIADYDQPGGNAHAGLQGVLDFNPPTAWINSSPARPPARRRPHAPADSRNTRARRRPCTSRRTRRSAARSRRRTSDRRK